MCPPYFSAPSAGSISIFFGKTLTSQVLEVPPFSIFLQSFLSTLYAVRPDDGSLLFCVSWESRVPYKVISSLRGSNYYVTYIYDTLHSTWFGTGTEEAIQKYLFNYIKLKCNIEDEWDSMHFFILHLDCWLSIQNSFSFFSEKQTFYSLGVWQHVLVLSQEL